MFYQTEAKPQGWRAVAVFDDDRAECLLYLGRSSTQVRAGYAEAFAEVLEEDEREHVQAARERGVLDAIFLSDDFLHVWLIMNGASEDALRAELAQFPLYPFMQIEITPLR